MRTNHGRVLRTGLSSLRDQAANLRCRLAALRFNPSRRFQLITFCAFFMLAAAAAGAQHHVVWSLFYLGMALWSIVVLDRSKPE